MEALAIVDYGNLYGVPHFWEATAQMGLKPIVGVGSLRPRNLGRDLAVEKENEKKDDSRIFAAGRLRDGRSSAAESIHLRASLQRGVLAAGGTG
jgi:hypothetical protein